MTEINMILKSNDFEDGGDLDPKFSCDGKGISPELHFDEVPEGTASLALSCIDPDSPSGHFVHWLVINLPVSTTSIPAGGPVPEGTQEIENDAGKTGFTGPCPGSGKHHYVFTLYALKTEKLDGVDKENFEQKIAENKIDKAKITGLYQRS